MSLLLFEPNNHPASACGIPYLLKRATLLFVALFILAGCAVTGRPPQPDFHQQLPHRVHLTDVPFHEQAALHCGPASLAMTLNWSGVGVGPDELAEQVFTPGRRGSLQSELITATRRHGRLGYPIHGRQCLFEALSSGYPVIVLQNLGLRWLPRWHYAVAVGYDLNDSRMILHTGRNADRSVGLSTFARTWQRAGQWGLLVLSPDEMPVCAEEQSYLQAALGLQQAGHVAAAQTAFHTAVGKWPHSMAARMGLGNALYAGGDSDSARAVFQQVTQMAPDHAAAFNNLAHILSEQASFPAAEAAARRAVELGGPHQTIYRKTLEEILQRAGEPSSTIKPTPTVHAQ